MSRVVVDLTEFATWSGHQTGIQRVVYGIAQGFYNTTDDVRFVSFRGVRGFEEIDFQQFAASLVPQETVGGQMNINAVKTVLKTIYQKSPDFMQRYVTPRRKENIKKMLKSTQANLRKMKNFKLQKPTTEAVRRFDFRRGDVIVTACRVWDSKAHNDALESLKVNNSVKLAYVLYDLIPVYKQHTFGVGLTERYSQYIYQILRQGDYIFPISDSSKADLLKFASEIGVLDVPVIKTIRLGDDISPTIAENPPYFVKDPHSFAISVGTIEARKNHFEIYYAYKLAHQRHVELPNMYIIGKPAWLTSDVIYFLQNDTDIKDKIAIMSDVSDRELAWLYKNALFTVYPSEYEGWGLPIAESLLYGTPVIASNTSSMVEIAPGLVDHVSPFDPHELLDKMAFYTDKKQSNKKREAITAGYTPQTWEKTASTIERTIKH